MIVCSVIALFSRYRLLRTRCRRLSRRASKEQYELFLDTVKPTPEQQQAAHEKFKQKVAILEAWDLANSAKLQAAKDAAAAARKGTDEDAKRKTDTAQHALQDDRVHVTYEIECAIANVLDAERKITWAGAQLAFSLMPKYGRVHPANRRTVDQNQGGLPRGGKRNQRQSRRRKKERDARNNVEKYVRWAIENVILTPEQMAANNGVKGPPDQAADSTCCAIRRLQRANHKGTQSLCGNSGSGSSSGFSVVNSAGRQTSSTAAGAGEAAVTAAAGFQIRRKIREKNGADITVRPALQVVSQHSALSTQHSALSTQHFGYFSVSLNFASRVCTSSIFLATSKSFGIFLPVRFCCSSSASGRLDSTPLAGTSMPAVQTIAFRIVLRKSSWLQFQCT